MDWITEVVKLFLDGTYKITHKIGLFMIVVICVLLTDNHFGFSSHWTNKGKIEDIAKLQELIIQKNTSPELVNKLHGMQEQILEQKNLLNHFSDFRSSLINQISFSNANIAININTKPIEYSLVYHVLSTSFWILILLLTVIVQFLITIYQEKKISIESIKLMFQIVAIAILSIIGLSFLTFMIPKFNPPFANYLINFLIITIVLMTLGLYIVIKNNTALEKRHQTLLDTIKSAKN
ncbi:hypothetical protein VB796_06750 [Arcicella sp. LKC2W]|uniref:hypothetical protein n=1 Tax=Arcicella sp. LKC2W TaxID=2984198 RepID=UPI002B200EAA|nr:hypothetical protein [Arcicella sp. LKC2W]MEA5458726.1 hypothetical protein [Arcicella sp. LKC2W]